MSARLLMIALDGADGGLLDRWSSDGTLPNLGELRCRGSVRRLTAPAGITDDGLWASFQYACGLGEHGRYHWRQRLSSGKMGMAFLDEEDRVSFWDVLSDQRLRVAVFDIPKCGRPKPINGIHLVDWLVHGRCFGEPLSYPESLAGEVVAQFGPAPPSRCAYEVPSLPDDAVLEVAANLRTSVSQKRAAGVHYLAAEPWDLFVIGFKEAHCAGHHLWDLADPEQEGYDAERTARLSDPVRTIFKDLDSAVGELIDVAGADADVVVFSPTDMEPNSTLTHLMPEVVRRMNRALGAREYPRVIRRLRRVVLKRREPCELLPYNENGTALRVHPQRGLLNGRLGKSRTRDQILARVESMVGELTDVETGEAVVSAVDRPSSEHRGTRAQALPDLLVRYPPGTYPRAVTSPSLGRIEAERPHLRPGDHAAGGMLISSIRQLTDVGRMQDLGHLAGRTLSVSQSGG